jgi:hypothetical protein
MADDDDGGGGDDREFNHHHTGLWSPLTRSLAKYLNRSLPESEKSGKAAKQFGPYTSVPLFGSAKIIGAQCGCMVFIPVLTVLVFVADVALAIIAGLDMLDRGSQMPYVQFSFSIIIAVLYMALSVMALTQYFWERVLDFKYHHAWSLGMAAALAWLNFGVWASWISHFHASADGVDSSADTVAFVTWAVANGVGVAGFMGRFVLFVTAIAIRYAYDRMIEIQAIAAHNLSNGSSIREILSGTRFGPPSLIRRNNARQQQQYLTDRRRRSPHLEAIAARPAAHPLWSETNYGARVQHQQENIIHQRIPSPPNAYRG